MLVGTEDTEMSTYQSVCLWGQIHIYLETSDGPLNGNGESMLKESGQSSSSFQNQGFHLHHLLL